MGFTEGDDYGADMSQESIFMVTELCAGGALGEKVLEQMAVQGCKVCNKPGMQVPVCDTYWNKMRVAAR